MDVKLIDRTAKDCRRIFARVLFLRSVCRYSIVWLFTWGIFILVLRVSSDIPRLLLLWGAAGCIPAVVLAMLAARRHLPGTGPVKALLDEYNDGGGLISASNEADVSAWDERITALIVPRITWQWGRTATVMFAGILFVGGSLYMPSIYSILPADRRMEIQELSNQLKEQLEVLEEERIMEETRGQELKEQLENIWRESTASDPQKSWEGLDAIEKIVADETVKAAEQRIAEAEKMAGMEALASDLAANAEENGSSEQVTAAMKEYAALMNKLGLDAKLAEKGYTELSEACAGMALTPEQLAQIAKALGKGGQECEGSLARLAEAGLLSAEMLERMQAAAAFCEAGKPGSSEELAMFLAENSRDGGLTVLMAMPGRGGINRGRGDAPMTWTDGTEENGAGFKEQTISPTALADIQNSERTGMSISAPENNEEAVMISGALTGTGTGGGSARSQVILPRHSRSVQEYFKRGDK